MVTQLKDRENRYFAIKESINGKGVFAKINFKKDQKLFQIKGKLITCNEDDNVDEETRSNTYRFDKDLYLSPKGRIGDFVNHSCLPNSKLIKIKDKLFIYSIKPIKKNQEIFFDYSTIIANDDSWKMNCNCGFSNCRKKIGKFKFLPQKTKNSYILRGMVPIYILDL